MPQIVRRRVNGPCGFFLVALSAEDSKGSTGAPMPILKQVWSFASCFGSTIWRSACMATWPLCSDWRQKRARFTARIWVASIDSPMCSWSATVAGRPSLRPSAASQGRSSRSVITVAIPLPCHPAARVKGFRMTKCSKQITTEHLGLGV